MLPDVYHKGECHMFHSHAESRPKMIKVAMIKEPGYRRDTREFNGRGKGESGAVDK
jgi:hypothetical protein